MLRPALTKMPGATAACFAALSVGVSAQTHGARSHRLPTRCSRRPRRSKTRRSRTRSCRSSRSTASTATTARRPAGGLTLDGYQSEAHARKDRKDWEAVQHVLAAGEMPPQEASRSRPRTRSEFVIDWIENALTKVDCDRPPKDPGRVTIRRLNRAEYNNTIRDLCGVDFKPADDFPADDVGYGFDNIGDVLSFPPLLLEKYLAAAEKILDAALNDPPSRVKSSQADVPAAEHPRHPARARRPRRDRRPTDRVHSPRARRSWRSSTSRPRASTSSGSAAGARRSATSSRRSPSAWTART